MANGYTIFFTYTLGTESGSTNGFGYSDAIHCNYINELYLENITNKEVNIYFDDINEFKYLNVDGVSGFSANKIHVIIQLIDNSTYDSLDQVKPIMGEWRKYDVTDQVLNYVSGQSLSSFDLTSTIFKVPLYLYYNDTLMPIYNLEYLNYPLVTQTGTTTLNTPLIFGEEEVFFGNVSTEIEAIAYTTDLAINLPTNEFNSSDNETWDGENVYITEVGLYDSNKNLVAIGKFNNPIVKDSTIARTIVFGIDF